MAARNGRYRNRVTIETPGEIVDGHGQAIKSWTTFAQPFASIEPLQGREFFAASEIRSEVTVRIRLHYLPGVTTKMRVNYDGRLYDIQSVIDPRELHREMQLMCSEGVTSG